MKKLIINFVFLLGLLGVLGMLPAKTVYARIVEENCTDACYPDKCAGACVECSWCSGGGGGGGTGDDTQTVTDDDITNPLLPTRLNSLSGVGFMQAISRTLISLIFLGGSLIFFFMFILSGIKWVSSGGDKAKLDEAQKGITSALVGLVILFSVFAIIKLVETIFGINITNLKLPTL